MANKFTIPLLVAAMLVTGVLNTLQVKKIRKKEKGG